MGLTDSKPEATTKSSLTAIEESYHVVSKHIYPTLGIVRTCRALDTTGKYYSVSEIKYDGDEEYEKFFDKKIVPRKHLLSQGLLTIVDCKVEKSPNMCWKQYICQVVYEHYNLTLEKELFDRLKLSNSTNVNKV